MRPEETRQRDPGPKAIAVGASACLHVAAVLAIVVGSAGKSKAVVEEPPVVMVTDFFELPRLGEERPESMLPRLTAPPEPEPAPAAPVNLNQEREEEQEKPQEKKPEEVEKPSEQLDPEALKREQEEARKRRKKEMERAMAKLMKDERLDEDSPEGMADGFAEGTGNRAAMVREQELWAMQVAARIHEFLEPPAGISPGECRKLSAFIRIVLDDKGKVTNEIKIATTSGNGFFDDAALRAVRQFTDEGKGNLPLPRADRLGWLRKQVMRSGVDLELLCAQ